MKEFKVLPTDDRFLDLTDEQMELLYHHYMIDNKPVKSSSSAKDNSYEEPESYHDPDFADEWDSLETGQEQESADIQDIQEDEWEEV